MPTGFMRHFIALLLLFSGSAGAVDIALIGVIGDKAAVLAFDGGEPKTVKVGQKWRGVTVLSIERGEAAVEVDGQRRVLKLGQHYRAGVAEATRENVTLAADAQGHFFADGMVNGGTVRFLLDTGATVVTLPAAEAQRLGIDYRKGPRAFMNTAAGQVPVYRVRLNTVRLGAIVVNDVEAAVLEQGLDVALLGMTFLNRVNIKREGDLMMLMRRF
jgi:aspartyl protease family protein